MINRTKPGGDALSRNNPEAYIQLDPSSRAVVDFIQSRLRPGDRLVAPADLANCYTDGRCQSYDDELFGEYQWVILHKDRLPEADARGLIPACFVLEPVFANEVFVIFASRERFKPLSVKDKHYRSFLASLAEGFVPARLAETNNLAPAKTPAEGFTLSASEIVKSLYRKLLGREADAAGLEVYTRFIIDQKSMDGVVNGIMATQEFRQKIVLRSPGDPIYLGDHRALIWTTHGLRMYVDTRDIVVAPHLLQLGYWENWVTAMFLKYLKKDATVIEVGANMGYYTMLAASRVGPAGKVFAFEANPALCELVFKSSEINGFRPACEVINKAVTDRKGTVAFHTWDAHLGLGSLYKFDPNYGKQHYDEIREITVESISLDDFIEEQGIAQVDFIKIDAEGSEPLIFKGLEKTLAKAENLTIIFEYSPMSRKMGFDVLEMLQGFLQKGFSLHRIDLGGRLFPITSLQDTLSWPGCEILMQKQSPAPKETRVDIPPELAPE